MTVDIGSLLQPVLVMLVQVLAPIIMGYIVLFLNQKIAEVRGRIDADKLMVAQELITRFVQAAQQAGVTGMIANIGEQKKAAVMAWTRAELAKRSITLDLETLDALVEATYFELIGQLKVFEDPVTD